MDCLGSFSIVFFVVMVAKVCVFESRIFVSQTPQADSVIVFRRVIIQARGVQVFVSMTITSISAEAITSISAEAITSVSTKAITSITVTSISAKAVASVSAEAITSETTVTVSGMAVTFGTTVSMAFVFPM